MATQKVVIGDQEVIKKLRALGGKAAAIIADATQAGAEVIEDAAERKAPGPHIERELTEQKANQATVEIGPDKEHWYYRFFETGATSHEIKVVGKQALRFSVGGDEVFAGSAQETGGVAAKPFLRNSLDTERQAAIDAAGSKFKRAIESVV